MDDWIKKTEGCYDDSYSRSSFRAQRLNSNEKLFSKTDRKKLRVRGRHLKVFYGPTKVSMRKKRWSFDGQYIVKDVRAGAMLTKENIRIILLGCGITPKKSVLLGVLLLCVMFSNHACGQEQKNLINEIIPYDGVATVDNIAAYYVVPPDYMKTKKYPLIIFLHGHGGTAQLNNLHTKYFLTFLEKCKTRGFIVGAPAYGKNSWMNDNGEKIVQEFIRSVKKELSIDENRIYLMGKSMGGGSALTFSFRNLDTVAAVCDIAGVTDYIRFYEESQYSEELEAAYGGSPKENMIYYMRRSSIYNVSQLQKIPVLIIHGDIDPTVPDWNASLLFERLKEEDSLVEFICRSNTGHYGLIVGIEDRILDFFSKH